ncbi:hypothetical protein FO519_001944 [Halicephalobus sp. NKZ332]|nr:hypothetical protein FO519_001944 [Halicephalobus sp. NKZ332]
MTQGQDQLAVGRCPCDIVYVSFYAVRSPGISDVVEQNEVALDSKENQFPHVREPLLQKSLESEIHPLPSFSSDKGRIQLLDETFNRTIIPEEVVKSINFLNEHHEVLNAEVYGGPQTASIVLVIQVHNRAEYLKILIESLQQVKGIEKALIIFSHDIYYPPVNELILNIKFCQVIQIFYPYPIQIFHNRFPGTDPNDCEEKIQRKEAKLINCNNWNSPDTYGHYRSAPLTQIKHHFWWKMNYVFDGILDKYHINTNIILLEEDHMVAPDIFHVLEKLIEVRNQSCNECNMLVLGLFTRNYNNYQRDIFKVGRQTWYGKHNTGMVLNRELWNSFKSCTKMFCEFDDYNWDWSMIQISYKCLPKKMMAIYAKSPRVLHIGDCGVHTHKCKSQNTANKIKSLFEKIKSDFFPSKMQLTETLTRVPKVSKPNGGWGDKRDHQLCLLNTSPVNASIWKFN